MNMLELTRRSGEKVYIRMNQIIELYKFGDITIIYLINGNRTEVMESVESIMKVLKDIGAVVYTV